MAKLRFKANDSGEFSASVRDSGGDAASFGIVPNASGYPFTVTVNGHVAGLTRKQALALAFGIIRKLAR